MKTQLTSLVFAALFVLPGTAEPPSPPTTDPQPAATSDQQAPLGPAVEKGLAWLAQTQNSDGGWGQGGGWRINTDSNRGGRVEGDAIPDPSDIGNTAIALQAFLRAGARPGEGPHAEVLERGARYILKQIDEYEDDSLFVTAVRDTQLQSKIGRYVDTFLAAQILADLKDRLPEAEDEQLRARLLDKVIAKIEKHQREDGAFAGNSGWAATLSQGIASRALNSAFLAGAEVDEATLKKDHLQNAEGLDRNSGVVAAATPAAGDAGVEIYRYAAKLGGMTDFARSNYVRRRQLEETAAAPAAPAEEKQKAAEELEEIRQADADQSVLLGEVAERVKQDKFVAGFGNNGGEEFISFMNIGEALRAKGGNDWEEWNATMTKMLTAAQNADGSWAGQHCITGRSFCTSSALMVLMTDRAPLPEPTLAAKDQPEPGSPEMEIGD